MGKLSRTKGAAWEREVAAIIRGQFSVDAKRTLTECRDGNVGDITCPKLPVTWQCKVGASPNVYKAVEEAEDAAPETNYAVAVIKRNASSRRGPQKIAALPLDHFLEILRLAIR